MNRWLLGMIPLLSACSELSVAPEAPTPGRMSFSPPVQPVPSDPGRDPRDPAGPQGSALEELPTSRGPTRLVIHQGALTLEVKESDRVEKELVTLAGDLGGWVQLADGPHVILRVPALRFDEAFQKISALGQVISHRITGSDVTDQYRDLKVRLENAERVRARLASILELAKSIPDALSVERELARVTEEIERLKGTIARLEDLVAYSTLAIELRKSRSEPAPAIRLPFEWVRRLGPSGLLEFEK